MAKAKMQEQVRQETIELLARHFTGPLVVHNSICLDLVGRDSVHAKMAQLFFDTREKLGIRGYVDQDEAIASLERLLEGD